MGFLAEWRDFIRESRRSFHDTGAVLPSSRFLGRAMASELGQAPGAARILEAGPGTGAVTAQILRRLRPGDQLDLVELNPRFAAILEKRLREEELFRAHRDQVRLINAAVESLPGEEVYDFIICGLPFNNFPHGLVRTIFAAFHRLLKPGGTLTYFEYAFVRHLKTPLCSRSERRRLFRVGRVVSRYIQECQVRRQLVPVNVPPAFVRHLRLKPPPA